MSETGKRLEQLGVTLLVRDKKGKGVVDAVQVGDSLFISVHFPTDVNGGAVYMGEVGTGINKGTVCQATRLYGLNVLATIKDYTGELGRVDYVVKALGLVNSAGGFFEQPTVMNGFSDLMVGAFGKRDQHAGSAVGACALGQNMPVAVEATVRIRR